MIQTTTPIFRGYTGGALVDEKGYLVGMLSGVVELNPDDVVGSDDMGLMAGLVHRGRVSTVTPAAATLALPALHAVRIANELLDQGYVERGYLGLEVELSRGRGASAASQRRGVLVHQVVPGGPAERAGLLPGDLILEFGSTRVHGPEELSFLVSSRHAGAVIPVRYLRRGHRISTSVMLDQAPPLDWDPTLDAPLAGAADPGDAGGSR
jgi:S1-C subfamily serine protease